LNDDSNGTVPRNRIWGLTLPVKVSRKRLQLRHA
jgi:hypothetical protein